MHAPESACPDESNIEEKGASDSETEDDEWSEAAICKKLTARMLKAFYGESMQYCPDYYKETPGIPPPNDSGEGDVPEQTKHYIMSFVARNAGLFKPKNADKGLGCDVLEFADFARNRLLIDKEDVTWGVVSLSTEKTEYTVTQTLPIVVKHGPDLLVGYIRNHYVPLVPVEAGGYEKLGLAKHDDGLYHGVVLVDGMPFRIKDQGTYPWGLATKCTEEEKRFNKMVKKYGVMQCT